eukprot:jgi/Psemu1/29326/gm1.29326_g
MDPDRVRAYLQISCAGLGFDIGELWWTSNKAAGSTSALAAIEEKNDTSGVSSDNGEKKLRFVQLYTSKSYEARRPMLIRPAEEEENDDSESNGQASEESSSDLEKHVLSPTLVDAISKTAQVVWAHTKKSEGLTGRSDIRLQTAVGMPVAVDRDGNMCVVVMFSPNNIQSTDNALEYLQSISRNEALPQLSNVLTDDVITRFVPLDENRRRTGNPKKSQLQPESMNDAFDEASYGVWSTIMQTLDETDSTLISEQQETQNSVNKANNPLHASMNSQICANEKHFMDIDRQERLEEFASAFLDVSIFDLAEVWLPTGQNSDSLNKVEPHETVDEDVWKHVAPADLGEMAADVEMHQHFMIKKRPIGAISTELESQDESVKSLTYLQYTPGREDWKSKRPLPNLFRDTYTKVCRVNFTKL